MKFSTILLGARRGPISSKEGNKNFYKGKGGGRMGKFTTRGNFIIQEERKRSYICPINMSLTPFVSPLTTKIVPKIHTLADYFEADSSDSREEARRIANKLKLT